MYKSLFHLTRGFWLGRRVGAIQFTSENVPPITVMRMITPIDSAAVNRLVFLRYFCNRYLNQIILENQKKKKTEC